MSEAHCAVMHGAAPARWTLRLTRVFDALWRTPGFAVLNPGYVWRPAMP
jgi:hypothetical protein